MTRTFLNATRLNGSVTAALEKRLLVGMARRLPRAVHSDHLTALAALSMLAAAGAYAWARTWPEALHLVNLCLLLNWVGDSLDGTVARVRDQQRPRYGFYIDHVLDCAGIAVLVVGMTASGLMSLTLGLAFLVGYFLVSLEVYLATYCLARFRMSFAGVGPTELRLLLAIGNLVALQTPVVTVWGAPWKLFDVGAAIAVPALVTAFLWAAVRNGAALSAAEPRPEARASRCADSPPSSDVPRSRGPVETPRESLA